MTLTFYHTYCKQSFIHGFFENCKPSFIHGVLKIYYDNTGNVPYKGRNFNTQIFGKMYFKIFVICMISRHWFQTKWLHILPNFGDFGAKMSFFHYIVTQKRNNFIKHCPPPIYQEAADIRDVYLYKKFSVQVGSWYTGAGGGGGNDVL